MKFKIKTLFALITLVCLAITIYRYGYTNGKADILEEQRQVVLDRPANIPVEIENMKREVDALKSAFSMTPNAYKEHP